MYASDFIARARKALGKGVPYVSPSPEFDPWLADPPQSGLDCGTFVHWAAKLVANDDPSQGRRVLRLDTTGIVRDANGARRFFKRIAVPQPGCVVVYPDYRAVPEAGHPGSDHQGHVGIVTEIGAGNSGLAVTRVIHCSRLIEGMRAALVAGAGQDSILEGGPLWFPVFKPIYAWCQSITPDPVQAANRD